MSMIGQWIIVAAIVVVAVIYFIMRFKRQSSGECCGDCSGCKHQTKDNNCSETKKQK